MPFEPGHLVAERAAELEQQPGLADAGLARDEHDLAAAALGLLEVLLEQRELALAADQRRQPALDRRLEPRADRLLPQCLDSAGQARPCP